MAERVRLVVRGIALLLLVTTTGYALQRWIFKPLRCSFEASVGARALEQSEAANDQTRRLAHSLRADLADCGCVSPPDVTIPMARGAAAEDDGDRATAITEYQRALEIDRRPEIYSLLATLHHETGDHAAAIDNLTSACTFDPKRLRDISPDLRIETEQRIRSRYGVDWIR
jgi:tetratricopeptide (TPR) repeat protein